MNKTTYLISIILLLVSTLTYAQTRSISGTVLDAENMDPLIGANVLIKGTLLGTVTDVDGSYTLSVDEVDLPYTLVVSYTGYKTQEVIVSNEQGKQDILMEIASVLGDEIVVSASRIEENILQSPVTIEKLDVQDIRLASSGDYFDEINKLKGVHSNQASLTFNTINTRGFATAGNTRFVQLMDGMDNAAPLLNFPTGNVVGISELDIRNVELVPGAASALYGPNAFNGILIMESKDPFMYPGLSAQIKYGVTTADNFEGSDPYSQVGIRYALPVSDKFAFKVDFSALQATDWLANDYGTDRNLYAQGVEDPSASVQTRTNFDGMNIYGDETQFLLPFSVLAGSLRDPVVNGIVAQSGGQLPAAFVEQYFDANINSIDPILLTRTGFTEEQLLDNRSAESYKASAALHYKLAKNMEAIYNYRFGAGSSVYQGSERYALRGFTQQFHKLEFKGSNYFLRGYVSQTAANNSYNLTALGTIASERISPTSAQWAPTYAGTYVASILGGVLGLSQPGMPPINVADLSDAQLAQVVAAAHANARQAADASRSMLTPSELQAIIEGVRNDNFQDPNGGAGFIDDSRLWHAEFNYDFAPLIEEIGLQVGGNYRQYDLFSDGTIFNEDPDGDGINERIQINEFGVYAQLTKRFLEDRLRLTGSLRYDKNENFDGQITPRVSAVYALDDAKKHNLRMSFQTGFRNPTTQGQFIFFPTTNTIIGGTPENAARYGLYEGGAYTKSSYDQFTALLSRGEDPAVAAQSLEIANISYIKPEQLTAYELGYKGLLSNSFFVDLHGYYNIYNDFIGQQVVVNRDVVMHKGMQYAGADPTSSKPFLLYTNFSDEITSWGAAIGLNYKWNRYLEMFGNYSWADFDQSDSESGLNAGFNTPNNRFTVGISGMNIADFFGFGVSYRWQEDFYYFSSFGEGQVDDYGIIDAQLSFKVPAIHSILKVGANNLFGDDYRTNVGNPFVGQLYYVSITYDQFMQ